MKTRIGAPPHQTSPRLAAGRRRAPWLFWLFLCLGFLAFPPSASTQEDAEVGSGALKLSEATMCETIRAFKPVNRGLAFPASAGKLFCFTAFQNIPAKMFIHHHWYRKDELVTRRGLQLLPPRWSSASSIQIRDADKGPWRVEITDESGRVLKTLRFSVTD